MVSELAVIGFAFILFAYWFRYNCRAILRSKSSAERARQVALANQLSFPDVAERLQQLPSSQLDDLNNTLLREYRILTCLLRYTAALGSGTYTVEQRMLILDFRLLQLWYRVTHKLVLPQARRSVEERLDILSYFANAMGERRAAISRA